MARSHHFVGERLGPFNQQILPVLMSSPSYHWRRQIAFRNQGSAEILIQTVLSADVCAVIRSAIMVRLLLMKCSASLRPIQPAQPVTIRRLEAAVIKLPQALAQALQTLR